MPEFMELVLLQARLREADDKLRDKEAELNECGRERDAERQRARELEAQVRRLQPLIQEREREIEVSSDHRKEFGSSHVQWQDALFLLFLLLLA